MAFKFENLDSITRKFMLEEIDTDINNSKLYLSSRLTGDGKVEYPELLKKAVQDGNEEILADYLKKQAYFNSTESRTTKKGIISAKIPSNANETLADGEFNRFYIRAICCRVLKEGGKLEIYRAKEVTSPRSESEAKIGQTVDPKKLLEDLRANPGVDTALGIPPGPNSGLSVRICEEN